MFVPGTRVTSTQNGRTGIVMTQPELSDNGGFTLTVDVRWDGDVLRSVVSPCTLRAAEPVEVPGKGSRVTFCPRGNLTLTGIIEGTSGRAYAWVILADSGTRHEVHPMFVEAA